jgi:hypothetical protein
VPSDTTNELEAPVQGLEHGPIEGSDLLPQLVQVVHSRQFCTVPRRLRPTPTLESTADT